MIHLIVSLAPGRIIGNKGTQPWYIKEDLQNFKKVTTGHTVLMGRRTYEIIGRPLPHRYNIVLSYERENIPGVEVCTSLDEALAKANEHGGELFVIGGATVYEQTLPLADRLHISHLKKVYSGDVYFPIYDEQAWEEIERREFEEFTYCVYKRKNV